MEKIQLNHSTLAPYAERIILKLLFEHNILVKYMEYNCWSDSVGFALGVPKELVKKADNDDIEETLKLRLIELEHSDLYSEQYAVLEENILTIQRLLKLSDCETAIFRLASYSKLSSELSDIIDKVSGGIVIISSVLKSLLGYSEKDIRSALKKKSKLYQYGLLDSSRYNQDLNSYLRYDNVIDIDELTLSPIDKSLLLKKCLKPAPTPTLKKSDFDHLARMRDRLQTHLQTSLNNKKKGANILIWGKSGSGKTELALYLAQTLEVDTYLLGCEDNDGDTIKPSRRLDYCNMAQTLLENQSAVIIFDEIEDVFCGGLFERSVAQENKAWVNQLLEQNNVPMIWLSNSVHSMDEAFLRRFDFVFEMPDLPLKKKEALMIELSQQKLPQAYAHHFAKHQGISNALTTRAFAVLNGESENSSSVEYADNVQEWFNQTLKAQGYSPLEKLNIYQADYNLNWVNCNENIQQISQGLIKTKSGRICCYGPAGTGKTAWANWLAQEADCPVLVKQGSDLLGMYVGETEKNIAAAFRQASENQMVLVFDEVDSFLFNRTTAIRSWETTMVNEMLTQIERFEGLLVVSTNLMDNLDPAVLRRFDLKLKFDFLNAEQICDTAKAQAEKLGINIWDTDFMNLEALKHLTLGDFAAVARRHRFCPFKNSEDWVKALKQECELKGIKGKTPFGF